MADVQIRNKSDVRMHVPVANTVVDPDEVFTVSAEVFKAHVWPESLYAVVKHATKKDEE